MTTALAVSKPVFVLQDNFVSVIVDKRPFPLVSSHPTFKAMVRAIRRKQWSRIPNLVNLAQSISNKSHGDVRIEGGEVFYKGVKVDNSLTKRMIQMIEHDKPMVHMLRFMDNLMKNPIPSTIQELYDFLERYSLPITDDGCFVAYKRVDGDYLDCHTHSVDNHIGQVPVMPFKDVDPNRYNVCSRGYHFCSRKYLSGFLGDHLMAVKINPADVVEIPESLEGKGRTWRYEVIAEVPNENYEKEDAAFFQQPLIAVGKDRNALISKLLAIPAVKRLVTRTEAARKRSARRKSNIHPPVEVSGLTRDAIRKASLGRLQHWYKRFSALAPVAPEGQSALFSNPTRPARIASRLTIVQIAREMRQRASIVYRKETADAPGQAFIDDYLSAIQRLKGANAGLSYRATKAAA